MVSVERQLVVLSDTERLYDAVGKASALSAWLGPAQFKVNQQFGSVMLKLFDELDFAVSETRSPLTVTWKCMSRRHAWTNSNITIGFDVRSEGVLVTLVQVGLLDEPDVLAATGDFWVAALSSLKRYVEVGDGLALPEVPTLLSGV